MKTEGKRVCEVCGTALNENSDFCPVCALLRAGGQESAPSEAPVSDSESSSTETEPSSIVRRFEYCEVMLDQDGQAIELGAAPCGLLTKRSIAGQTNIPVDDLRSANDPLSALK